MYSGRTPARVRLVVMALLAALFANFALSQSGTTVPSSKRPAKADLLTWKR